MKFTTRSAIALSCALTISSFAFAGNDLFIIDDAINLQATATWIDINDDNVQVITDEINIESGENVRVHSPDSHIDIEGEEVRIQTEGVDIQVDDEIYIHTNDTTMLTDDAMDISSVLDSLDINAFLAN